MPRLALLCLCLLCPILFSPPALAQWEANEAPARSAAAQPSLSPSEVQSILKSLSPGDEYIQESSGATGVGAGVDSQGEKIDQQHTGSPPRASLTDVGDSEGGGSSTTSKLTSALKDPNIIRIIAGVLAVLCFVSAGVSAYMKWRPSTAPKLIFYGLSFAVCAWFPDILVAVFVVTTTIDLIDTLTGSQLAIRFKEALRGVTAGVASLPGGIGSVQEMVKDAIEQHTDEPDKAVIKKIKKADDLK